MQQIFYECFYIKYAFDDVLSEKNVKHTANATHYALKTNKQREEETHKRNTQPTNILVSAIVNKEAFISITKFSFGQSIYQARYKHCMQDTLKYTQKAVCVYACICVINACVVRVYFFFTRSFSWKNACMQSIVFVHQYIAS